jgi:hypothetical protein
MVYACDIYLVDTGDKLYDAAGARTHAQSASRTGVRVGCGKAVVVYADRVEGACGRAAAETEAAVETGLVAVAGQDCRLAIPYSLVHTAIRGFSIAALAMDHGHHRVRRGYRYSQNVTDLMGNLRASGNAARQPGFTCGNGSCEIRTACKAARTTVHIREDELDFAGKGVVV